MEYQEYINQKKEIYEYLYLFIKEENEEEEEEEENYQRLLENIKKQSIQESKEELVLFLRLLLNIFNHHHRYPSFSTKFFKILDFLSETIKQIFTNIEIFELLKSNRMIILHLIDKGILRIDEPITNKILQLSQGSEWSYKYFFYPEIKPYISEGERLKIENFLEERNFNILDTFDLFDQNRHRGENDSMISSFIRSDSVSELDTYLNKTNLPLSSQIRDSIFESNSILNEKPHTLIEYGAFYGSIQVVKYLWLKHVELSPSLWIYGIHSNNAELIHFLEENHVEPPKGNYQECLLQSIECHHNEISEYISSQLLASENSVSIETHKNKIDTIVGSINFKEIPSEICDQFLFFYLCFYGYSELVNLYMKPKINKMKEKIIQNIHFHNKVRIIIILIKFCAICSNDIF